MLGIHIRKVSPKPPFSQTIAGQDLSLSEIQRKGKLLPNNTLHLSSENEKRLPSFGVVLYNRHAPCVLERGGVTAVAVVLRVCVRHASLGRRGCVHRMLGPTYR
jgi:hypothetical protein